MSRSDLIDRLWQAVGILAVTVVLTGIAVAWAWDVMRAP